MKKSFITNLALLLSLNLLIKPFWIFGIDRTVQNITGAQEYGFYASLFSFSIIFNILLDIGITNFNTRNIAQHSHLLKKYFSNFVVLKLLLGLVYAIVCIVAGLLLGYGVEHFQIIFLLIFNQFLLSMLLFIRSNFAGLHLFKTDSIISVIDRLLLIILCGILLVVPYTNKHFSIVWFVYAQTIAYLIATLIAFLLVSKYTGSIKFQYNKKILLLILKQSYPFALLVLLMSLYSRIDMVMLERLLADGSKQAGIYVQAYRILEALTMFGLLFANILFPMFSRMLKNKEPIENLAQQSFFLIIVPSILLSVAGVLYSSEIMTALYHRNSLESASVFSILIIGFISYCTTYIFGTLLTANNNLKQLNIMAIIGLVINIVLNFILIPKYKALGAAYSNLATQMITAIIQVIMAVVLLKFTYNYKKLIFFLLFIVSVILLSLGVYRAEMNWILGIFLILTLGFLMSFVTGLIQIKSLINQFKPLRK